MASSSSRWRAVFGGTTTLMSAAKEKAKTTTTTKARSNIGIQKVLQISPQLGKFLDGATESSRTHAVKKVWEHVKLHHLQNPANRKEIFCDEKLKSIFDGKEKVQFQEIAKFLSNHFVKSS
ncbi:protein TRI1-like [Quercus lobata]|uniref:DM2 domain-containing protein n=1 Tax=Quercus lobata TaxID=97700 RepID=A0A7N2N3Y4_QUELO|nr:protein TRI1-like [Quercus lobata]